MILHEKSMLRCYDVYKKNKNMHVRIYIHTCVYVLSLDLSGIPELTHLKCIILHETGMLRCCGVYTQM